MRADHQVFPHRHAREQAAAFRRKRNAHGHTLRGVGGVDALAIQGQRTRGQLLQTHQGLERGALARAVGAHQRHDLARVDLEAHTMQRLDQSVMDHDVLDLKRAQLRPLPDRPRSRPGCCGYLPPCLGQSSALAPER
ncbi:hypothetical protein SDC9_89328 [bioreactor metagenome]|uniref:Uncharacterized protein n=1 Tax=bioreactor metagenome TaxID=1076179 RepID=A0A644ZRZ7_9ZZZZ